MGENGFERRARTLPLRASLLVALTSHPKLVKTLPRMKTRVRMRMRRSKTRTRTLKETARPTKDDKREATVMITKVTITVTLPSSLSDPWRMVKSITHNHLTESPRNSGLTTRITWMGIWIVR